MVSRTGRIALFFTFCLGSRSLLAYAAAHASPPILLIMGYFAIIPSLWLLYVYATGASRIGAFGGEAWWNSLRPVHAIIYLLFAYSAIHGKTYAWKFLLFDVILGLVSFVKHYFL